MKRFIILNCHHLTKRMVPDSYKLLQILNPDKFGYVHILFEVPCDIEDGSIEDLIKINATETRKKSPLIEGDKSEKVHA